MIREDRINSYIRILATIIWMLLVGLLTGGGCGLLGLTFGLNTDHDMFVRGMTTFGSLGLGMGFTAGIIRAYTGIGRKIITAKSTFASTTLAFLLFGFWAQYLPQSDRLATPIVIVRAVGLILLGTITNIILGAIFSLLFRIYHSTFRVLKSTSKQN